MSAQRTPRTITTVFRDTDRIMIVRAYGPKSHVGAVIMTGAKTNRAKYLYGRYQKQIPMSEISAWCSEPPVASDLELISWFDGVIELASARVTLDHPGELHGHI